MFENSAWIASISVRYQTGWRLGNEPAVFLLGGRRCRATLIGWFGRSSRLHATEPFAVVALVCRLVTVAVGDRHQGTGSRGTIVLPPSAHDNTSGSLRAAPQQTPASRMPLYGTTLSFGGVETRDGAIFFCLSGEVFDFFGVPGVTRTPDLRFRKPPLYPTELRGQTICLDFLCGRGRKSPLLP